MATTFHELKVWEREFRYRDVAPFWKLASFLDRINFDGSDGCWLWRAGTTTGGYGVLPLRDCMVMAHRFSYTVFVGDIPKGRHLHHKCGIRLCVNPGHLEPVTPAEHGKRWAPNSITTKNARATHCVNGHEFTKKNTYTQRKKDGRTRRVCRTCKREWAQHKAKEKLVERPPRTSATYCRHGHEYNKENTYMFRGARLCKACHKVNNLQYARKRTTKKNQSKALASLLVLRSKNGEATSQDEEQARLPLANLSPKGA